MVDSPLMRLCLFLLCVLIALTASAQDAPARWTTHDAGTLTLRAPSDWVAVTGSEVGNGLQLLALSNPNLRDFTAVDYDLYLLDVANGISINVTTTPLGALSSMRDVMETLAAEYNRLGLNVQAAALVTLPAGSAGRFTLSPRTLTPDEVSYTTSQYQYVIFDAGRLHFITMTAPPETFAQVAPTFERVANTLQITDGTRGWARYRGTSLGVQVPPGWASRAPGQNVQIALGLPDNSARLAISRTPLQDIVPVDEIRVLLETSYIEQGREVVALEVESLPIGDFVRGYTVYDGGDTAQIQYAGVIGNDYVTATFTIAADLAQGYALVFAQIMDTLTLNG